MGIGGTVGVGSRLPGHAARTDPSNPNVQLEKRLLESLPGFLAASFDAVLVTPLSGYLIHERFAVQVASEIFTEKFIGPFKVLRVATGT